MKRNLRRNFWEIFKSCRKNLLTQIALLMVAVSLLVQCSTTGETPEASLGDLPSKGPVGRTLKAHASGFTNCGKDSVTIQTGMTQHLRLRFIVNSFGKVSNPDIERMSSPDPDLRSCVLRVLKSIQFPKPKDGQSKEIVYPLTIKPS